MIYHFLYPLHGQIHAFNVFRYITFRCASAILTALLINFIFGPWVIRKLRELKVGQQVREDGPATHLGKAGTPTMGGILILISVAIPTLLWSDLTNRYVWLVLGATLSYGAIGFYDDYLKIVRKKTEGLKARYKFGWQVLIGLIIGLLLYFNPTDPYKTVLSIPFLKNWVVDLAWFYVPFVVLVLVGSSNAVNLTDGLDGLAIGLVGIAAFANAILVYVTGNKIFAGYLQVLFLPGAGELTVFCGALMGASIGFLWYNAHPAEVFMGDVGSLGLGGALGMLAVLTKHEFILVIIGGIFVVEAMSVMIQVASFKSRGKRIFLMAPIHHHFEKAGWPEPKVIVRFWIIGVILALVGLSTLKLR
jgi:phospho-N-acetylmuramoyl-pentapeptide-transferase